jgi:hypothetical protein
MPAHQHVGVAVSNNIKLNSEMECLKEVTCIRIN